VGSDWRGDVWAVCCPPSAEQRAGQNGQGTQLLWSLTNFGEDRCLLPLSNQTQDEVGRRQKCQYHIGYNRAGDAFPTRLSPGLGRPEAGLSKQVPQLQCAQLWAGDMAEELLVLSAQNPSWDILFMH